VILVTNSRGLLTAVEAMDRARALVPVLAERAANQAAEI
jgi:hypothetical protein